MRQNLAGIDRNTWSPLGRLLQEAFRDGIDGDLILGGALTNVQQDVYAQSIAQNYLIGSLRIKPDGRKFVYSQAGASPLTLGHMGQAEAPTSNWYEQVQSGYGWAANAKSGTILITTGAAPGVNELKDGWMLISGGTGYGQFHQIAGNTSHLTTPTVDLYEGLLAALPAASDVTLLKSNYKDIIVVATGGLTARPVGVPLLTVTAAYFYWAQIEGPAPLMLDTGESPTIGDPVGHPAACAVAGACGVIVTLKGAYGRVLHAVTADEYAIVDLALGR